MKKTAKKILTINLKERDMSVYKLSHNIKYKSIDGTTGETPYMLVSRLEEPWSKETLGFACNPNGRILDFEYNEIFVEDDMSEEEALIKQGYTIIT